MALFLDLKVGDSLDVDNGRVAVTLVKKSGAKMRVKVDADRSVPVRIIVAITTGGIAATRGLSARK